MTGDAIIDGILTRCGNRVDAGCPRVAGRRRRRRISRRGWRTLRVRSLIIQRVVAVVTVVTASAAVSGGVVLRHRIARLDWTRPYGSLLVGDGRRGRGRRCRGLVDGTLGEGHRCAFRYIRMMISRIILGPLGDYRRRGRSTLGGLVGRVRVENLAGRVRRGRSRDVVQLLVDRCRRVRLLGRWLHLVQLGRVTRDRLGRESSAYRAGHRLVLLLLRGLMVTTTRRLHLRQTVTTARRGVRLVAGGPVRGPRVGHLDSRRLRCVRLDHRAQTTRTRRRAPVGTRLSVDAIAVLTLARRS